ncbi:MAG: DUF58 domain-containing protein [Clostridiales bacterium]|nr:DUF58 domain-containing protein [Clostridiales bacterium]
MYASGLLAAGLYYVFDARYFSWIIWCVLLLLPVLGLLLVLPFYSRCRLSLQCVRIQEMQERCPAAAAVQAELPVTPVKLYLRCENLFDGKVIKRKVYLRPGQEMPAEQMLEGLRCGVVRCRIRRAGMLDLLGLFSLPVRVPAAQEFLLLPAAHSFPAQLAEEAGAVVPEGESQTPSAHGVEREWRDVRQYREGDSLRDIHWKLTARHNQVIVRESVPLAAHMACFAVWWNGGAAGSWSRC